MRVILLGPPGAGKGTQAERLIQALQIPHISTGDIFRANIKNETELGKKVKSYLNEGQLVPDELTIEIVWDRLDTKDCENGFLLDGFPRTIPQADALDKGLNERGIQLNRVINIAVDKEVLVNRLAGRRVCPNCGAVYHAVNKLPKVEGVCDICGDKPVQRPDDMEDTVLERIEVYESQTAPLIEYYEENGLLTSVDGTLPIDDITDQILRSLNG